jgi:hypothetical protein
MRFWMPFLVAHVPFLILPVIFNVSAGVMDFSVTITATAAFTTNSTNPLCKRGALSLGHPGDYSCTVLVQEMQTLLAVLGIKIVSDGEISMQILLNVYNKSELHGQVSFGCGL